MARRSWPRGFPAATEILEVEVGVVEEGVEEVVGGGGVQVLFLEEGKGEELVEN